MVARRWRKAFAVTKGVSAVANADDPHVVWAASVILDVTWVSLGQQWTADSALCPSCGLILHRAAVDNPGNRDWSCSCGFADRPSPGLSSLAFSSVQMGERPRTRPAASGHGEPGGTRRWRSSRLMCSVSLPISRSRRCGRWCRSVAAIKRSRWQGGSAAAVGEEPGPVGPRCSACSRRRPRPVVIAINARAADGKDPVVAVGRPVREVVGSGGRRHRRTAA